MKQQINLYQPEQQKAEHPVNARNCGLVLLACFSTLLIVASYNNSTLGEQQQQLASLEQQRINLKGQFEQLSSVQFNTDIDVQLQQQVEQLTATVEAAERRKQWLNSQQYQQVSWSTVLENALNSQTDNVKLTNINSNAENNTIELVGQTTEATLIGDFILAASASDSVNMGTEKLLLDRQSSGFQFQATLSLTPKSSATTPPSETPTSEAISKTEGM